MSKPSPKTNVGFLAQNATTLQGVRLMTEDAEKAFQSWPQAEGDPSPDERSFAAGFRYGKTIGMRLAYSIVVKQQMAAHKKSMPVLEALNAGNTAFVEALDEIEGEASIECLGYCETCSEALFSRDRGYHDTDAGMYFCSDHAPTYADWKATAENEPDAFEDEEQRLHGLQEVQAHIDAGGKLTDNITYELP